MFHRSFTCLTRASSLSWPIKLASGQWLERSGQQTKSLSRSSMSFHLAGQNDRFDRNKTYELKHYEMGHSNEQLDRFDGMQNGRNQNRPNRRQQQYPAGLTNDRRNQLTRLNRSTKLDTSVSRGFNFDLDPNSTVVERDYIRSVQPELPPTFNLATYANHLDIIKQLVKLEVNICYLERKREVAKYLITLDFDKHVVPYLNFLARCGLRRDDFGNFLTQNFKVLQDDLENLQKRYDYYLKMKFTKKQITEMMLLYPKLISYPIDCVDAKLGYFQRYLRLKPAFVRKMLYNCPIILKTDKVHLEVIARTSHVRDRTLKDCCFGFWSKVTNSEVLTSKIMLRLLTLLSFILFHTQYTKFALIEQCGFRNFHLKEILINNPSILLKENSRVTGSFEYIFEHITKDLNLICKFSDVLCVNVKFLEERDQYLKRLGRAQYDPLKPLYVPLHAFLITDEEFLAEFAKADPEDMNKFLKTL